MTTPLNYSGNSTGQEPKQAIKILEALKNVMDPNDSYAQDLYNGLECEIQRYKDLAAEGVSEWQLDGFYEANILGIIDEIDYQYLQVEPDQ